VKAENCDRYGCTLGGRRITYGKLRHYVCDECGGAVTHRFTQEGDSVACARCGSAEIISESRYLQQISDAAEVMAFLPPQFRALYVDQEPELIGAQQSIDDLFGIRKEKTDAP